MKTLVYFASGSYKPQYQNLPFNNIYLIDNCFKLKRNASRVHKIGKVTCIGMDCLESIQYLKENCVKIDCFVSLNEGLYEGGGSYAINSDMFLGYVMPLLQENYVHIMNRNYYCNSYKVSMDLPYLIKEIFEDDNRYLSPSIFSVADYHKGNTKVFLMKKVTNNLKVQVGNKITLSICNDSIWNFFEELDLLAISIKGQGQGIFFDKIAKVVNTNTISIERILEYCVEHKLSKVGFTPWLRGKYNSFYEIIKNYDEVYPREIELYHLNKSDFKDLKSMCGHIP